MPALPAVSKVVRCDFHFSQTGTGNIQIREFFSYSGVLGTTDAATWLAAMMAALGTFTSTKLSSTLDLVDGELTDLTSTSAPQVLNSSGAAGGDGAQPAAAGTALVIRKHIVRRYRGGHPRTYLPGVSAADLSNPAVWNPTYLANMVAAYQTFITSSLTGAPMAVGTTALVNVSYYQGFTVHIKPSGRAQNIPTPRVTPVVDQVVNISGNPRAASQRRRNEN